MPFLTTSYAHISDRIVAFRRKVNNVPPPTYNIAKLCVEDLASVSRKFSLRLHAFFLKVILKVRSWVLLTTFIGRKSIRMVGLLIMCSFNLSYLHLSSLSLPSCHLLLFRPTVPLPLNVPPSPPSPPLPPQPLTIHSPTSLFVSTMDPQPQTPLVDCYSTVELRCSSTTPGVQYVTTDGELKMPTLPADNLVHSNT